MSEFDSIRRAFNVTIFFDENGIGRTDDFVNALNMLTEIVENLSTSGTSFNFADLVAALQEGTNINFTVDPVLETITINGSEMDSSVFDGDGTPLTPFALKNFADSKEYVNKDGAWAEATGGGGGGDEKIARYVKRQLMKNL